MDRRRTFTFYKGPLDFEVATPCDTFPSEMKMLENIRLIHYVGDPDAVPSQPERRGRPFAVSEVV